MEHCIISSVRSSSGYHGLLRTYIHTQQPTFPNFSNSSDSKVKVKVKGPNMQSAKCLKDQTCAIILKIMGFKDIRYDIPVYQM